MMNTTRSYTHRFLWTAVILMSAVPIVVIAASQGLGTPQYPEDAVLTDPVALLQARIDSGNLDLGFNPERGYLDSLLESLDIPVSSQTLVFSKTSLQAERISPDNPRALYFNDEVYVGWVRDGPLIELASTDPTYGTIFYTLAQEHDGTPAFQREGFRCIACHRPARNAVPVPMLMVMSVVPNEAGQALGTSVSLTTDQTPMNERWGGWYVTGTHGSAVHMGNMLIGDPEWALGEQANRTDLAGSFDQSGYLNGHSDIVAMTILVHQAEVHNLIGEAGYRVRQLIEEEAARERWQIRPDPAPSAETLKGTAEAVEPLVRALLFSGAAPLEAPIRGTSGFAEEFSNQGPRDSRGRSLRDLDLEGKLLRYPMSYLIYSESFDALPDLARQRVYERLWEVLTGRDRSAEFEHLSDADRTAILEILSDTKPEFRGGEAAPYSG